MENIVAICITFFISVLTICLTIFVIVEGKRKSIEIKIKKPPLEGEIPIGMMESEVIGNPRPKRSQCSPPKYFEYAPMSDEVKKVYDAALEEHRKRKVDEPLLVITLKDNRSEPEIIYEGEPIEALDDLQFNYHTPAHSLKGKDLGLKIEFTSGRFRVKVNRAFQ
ncbi:hypothetical protein [Carnobacterium maltaromaticum]|uniref:hypothetical protein n=1 Tax=Carnobacterium maltaromaticum TaxID=2751 RepID=UPI0039B08C5B